MTAEPLCLVGQQQQQERQQKQTTIEQSTKSSEQEGGSNEDGSGNSNNNNKSKKNGKSGNRLVDEIDTVESSSSSSSNSSEEDNTNWLCIDEFKRNSKKDNSTTKRVARRLIDSRSILTNKEKLKRFWERKMELEFKLRHQNLSELDNNNLRDSVRSNGQQLERVAKVAAPAAHKLVTFDENNNSSSDASVATSATAGCFAAHSHTPERQQQQVDEEEEEEENSLDKEHQHTIQFSDEEWRSLSPNVEPTSSASRAPGKKQQQQQQQPLERSPELLCEKLREYRATCAIQKQQQQQIPGERSKEPAVTESLALEQAGRGDKLATKKGLAEARKDSQVAFSSNSNTSSAATDSSSSLSDISGGQTDEIQLMSIDPTLCHSGAPTGGSGEERFASSGAAGFASKSSTQENHQAEVAGSFVISEREEQSANEEFSSSNSSFGPMSISIPIKSAQDQPVNNSIAQQQPATDPPEPKSRKQQQAQVSSTPVIEDDNKSELAEDCYEVDGDEDDDDDDDERNLTQSGSVLTVITAHDDPSKSQTSSFDHVSIENEAPDLISSMALEESKNNENLNEDEDNDEPKSNIGVAFESLQFDTGIKSSVQEIVEEESTLHHKVAPPVFKRSLIAKFDSKVVNSVCNFINAAITDASKQVENVSSASSSFSSDNNRFRKSVDTTIDDYYSSEINNNSTGHEGDDEADLSECKANNIQHRATFVQESASNSNSLIQSQLVDGQHKDRSSFEEDDLEHDELHYGEQNEGNSCSSFKADLSSIFEANVRREIERFETNSAGSKSKSSSASSTSGAGGGGGGGKTINKNALTEWRIAEEIRIFNEREMELKKRFKVIKNGEQDDTELLHSSSSDTSSTAAQQVDSSSSQVVAFSSRFGASKAAQVGQQSEEPSEGQVQSRSIKLSTSVTTDNKNSTQPITMISMHKFISSGGKRFVFTSSSNSNNNLSSATTNQNFQNKQLTKSMSNLASSCAINSKADQQQQVTNQPTKVVDYKAVDSLRCKETPNVKPGLTRKVIETFSRLNTTSTDSNISPVQLYTASHKQNNNNRITNELRKQPSVQPPAIMTAEWKIQEELREMRAREAELRDQQRNNNNNNQLARSSSNGSEQVADPQATVIAPSNGLQSIREQHFEQKAPAASCALEEPDKVKASNNMTDNQQQQELIRALDRSSASSQVPLETCQKSSSNRLSFSNDSLYPIKQTIDSFKKFSSQANSNNNNNSTVPSQHVSVTKIQRKLLQGISNNNNSSTGLQIASNEHDYELKVGGQRRKINMIEKWENGIHKPF